MAAATGVSSPEWEEETEATIRTTEVASTTATRLETSQEAGAVATKEGVSEAETRGADLEAVTHGSARAVPAASAEDSKNYVDENASETVSQSMKENLEIISYLTISYYLLDLNRSVKGYKPLRVFCIEYCTH